MTPECLVLAGAVAAVLAFVLVGVVRRIALHHGVLDHPSDRSSHTAVTPRGGGLGLLGSALALSFWRSTRPIDWATLLLLVGTVLVAVVGWIDDRRGLAVRTRLTV